LFSEVHFQLKQCTINRKAICQ